MWMRVQRGVQRQINSCTHSSGSSLRRYGWGQGSPHIYGVTDRKLEEKWQMQNHRTIAPPDLDARRSWRQSGMLARR